MRSCAACISTSTKPLAFALRYRRLAIDPALCPEDARLLVVDFVPAQLLMGTSKGRKASLFRSGWLAARAHAATHGIRTDVHGRPRESALQLWWDERSHPPAEGVNPSKARGKVIGRRATRLGKRRAQHG